MKEIDYWLTLIANLFTIFASGIAIYIFTFNKKKIQTAFNFLLNYSQQLTLNDLKYKIERLNDFNTTAQEHKIEVVNIMNEIEGQINGNTLLKDQLKVQLSKINGFTANPKTLTEPKKRSIVSELRESIRNIDTNTYQELVNYKSKSK